MLYYSTNNRAYKVSLKEAVLKSLAPDNGLFMPEYVPQLPKNFIDNLHQYSFVDMAFEVAKSVLGSDVPDAELRRITEGALNFPTPIVNIAPRINVLELWHGPTMAFKDVAARFMARLIGYLARESKEEIYILVATSGDTGSAVASGFYNVEGIKVVLLYPSGGVSTVQEQLLTTMGGNIIALEVSGVFDDCQRLVKSAFLDAQLREHLNMTSANSINIARLLPQSFYYFNAYAQLPDKSKPVVFSVPSGNYGNVTGGLFAKRMGLPVSKMIVSSNINNAVPMYLQTGEYNPKATVATISNAMDVGNPSNFARLQDMYNQSVDALRNDLTGYYFSDDQTREAMRQIRIQHNYLMDPHGAVAYLGLKEYTKQNPDVTGVVLETAHPAKFLGVVNQTLGIELDVPGRLASHFEKKKIATPISDKFEDFKKFLMALK